MTDEKIHTWKIKESDLFILATALREYKKDPISEEHGNRAEQLYSEVKDMVLGQYISDGENNDR